MITFQKFIEKNNGKYVEVAGSAEALNQCTDLANLYIRDVLGFPIIEWTNAVDFPSKAEGRYEWIKNSLTAVPKEGDLVIFNISTYGHISIFIEGDTKSFRSFDQNFPLGTPCHVQNHTYNNVKGWLTPNIPTNSGTLTPEIPTYLSTLLQENKLDLNNEGQIRDFFQKAIEFDGVKKDLENAKNQISIGNGQLSDLTNSLSNSKKDLNNANEQITRINKLCFEHGTELARCKDKLEESEDNLIGCKIKLADALKTGNIPLNQYSIHQILRALVKKILG